MKSLDWVLLAILCFVGTIRAAQLAKGPLRRHPTNGAYFTDGSTQANGRLKAIYLTGSHTWPNLIDRGPSDSPPKFDFPAYLTFLQANNHNLIRLWARHVSWYNGYGEGELHASPLAWVRSGPGIALDGKPRFDLQKLNQPYFERLRERVMKARDAGIYVIIMFFGGSYECRGGWRGNPFHRSNNINQIDGDPNCDDEGLESHTLQNREILRIHEAYVRKVIDTVNDLDNVLYEISNEGGDSSEEWQVHLINLIRAHQAQKPKQHPIGMTTLWTKERTTAAQASTPAEWISPMTDAVAVRDIPAVTKPKVHILDSDHWFVHELYSNPLLGREWVWKAFCRGYNTMLMEHLPPLSFHMTEVPLSIDDPGYTASRTAMGWTRRFAERMDLAAMKPHQESASSRFCLANPGQEYLIYFPVKTTEFSVAIRPGIYSIQWYNPVTSELSGFTELKALRQKHTLNPPFDGDAVCYIKAK